MLKFSFNLTLMVARKIWFDEAWEKNSVPYYTKVCEKIEFDSKQHHPTFFNNNIHVVLFSNLCTL